MSLKDRIKLHADKVKKHEEMEAALAGVFSEEAQASREKFVELVRLIVKPAFTEFKATMRELGRDAVIVTNLSHTPSQSIGLTLIDRYLTFGAGKTLKLVNPKDDLAKSPTTKFYEVFTVESILHVRQRVDPRFDPIATQVTYEDVTQTFVENELAAFFERAYPPGS